MTTNSGEEKELRKPQNSKFEMMTNLKKWKKAITLNFHYFGKPKISHMSTWVSSVPGMNLSAVWWDIWGFCDCILFMSIMF